jgi:hypothetical protein
LAISRDVAALNQYFNDNGLQAGGPNAIVDGDCTGSNSYMTAAQVNAGMTAIVNLVLTPAQRQATSALSNSANPPASV